MVRTIVAILLVWGAIHPSRAFACSCVPRRSSRVVVPNDGALEFPTDGTIYVFLTAFPAGAHAAVAREYRLRDDRGALVRFRSTVQRTRLDLTPASALRPNTQYTLEQVVAYGRSGQRVTDTDRLRGRDAPFRGVWSPVASFRTAASSAAPRTITAGLERPVVMVRHSSLECGPGIAVGATANLSAIGQFDVLELHVEHQGVVATTPAAAGAELAAGNLMCSLDPVAIQYSDAIVLELVVRDASGAVVGRSGWVRPTRQGSPPIPILPIPRLRRAAPSSLPSSWPPIPIAAPPTTSDVH